MANVLPQRERIAVARRINVRFLFIGACFLAAGAVVALLALIPSLISVRIARASAESSVPAASPEDVNDDQAAANNAQKLIAVLKPLVQATTSPSEVVGKALAQRPAGIAITTITYTGGTPGKLVLSGTSATRDAVNAFRAALEHSGVFDSVSVPVAALVGAQEGEFTVTLSGSF